MRRQQDQFGRQARQLGLDILQREAAMAELKQSDLQPPLTQRFQLTRQSRYDAMIVALHLCDMPASDPLRIARRQRLHTTISFYQAENGIAVNARQSLALPVGKQFIRLRSGDELALPGSDRRLEQERIG